MPSRGTSTRCWRSPMVDVEAIRAKKFHRRAGLRAWRGRNHDSPALLERLGCRVSGINLETDGKFPRAPEPLPENLGELSRLVRESGAVDRLRGGSRCGPAGAGGREGASRSARTTPWRSRCARFWRSCRAAEPRAPSHRVVANLSTSLVVEDAARMCGARFVRAAVGEANVARAIRDERAVIGGEGNGGVILPALHIGRDAPVGVALILHLLARSGQTVSALVAGQPRYRIVKAKGPRGKDLAPVYARLDRAHSAMRRRIPATDCGSRGRTDGCTFDHRELSRSCGSSPKRQLPKQPNNWCRPAANSWHSEAPQDVWHCRDTSVPARQRACCIEGLRRLEYRGYDSSGIAVVNGDGLTVLKQAGKLSALEKQLDGVMPKGSLGIGHTRWATHGAPTTPNAHPHTDQTGRIALIHNGIIENSGAIRRVLEQRGHTFKSETDTEVLAHLVGECYNGNIEEAVAQALREVDGAYGIAVICSEEPDVLVAARKGSPLLVGSGRERVVRGLRRFRDPGPHPLGRLSRRRRDGGAQPEGLPRAGPGRHPDREAGQPHRVGHRHHRARRFLPLHAEGDLRAARHGAQHHAGSPARGRGHVPGLGPQPHRRRYQADQPDRHHRVRHFVARRPDRRVHAGGAGPDPGRGGIRLGVPLPEPGGGRSHPGHRDLPVG